MLSVLISRSYLTFMGSIAVLPCAECSFDWGRCRARRASEPAAPPQLAAGTHHPAGPVQELEAFALQTDDKRHSGDNRTSACRAALFLDMVTTGDNKRLGLDNCYGNLDHCNCCAWIQQWAGRICYCPGLVQGSSGINAVTSGRFRCASMCFVLP